LCHTDTGLSMASNSAACKACYDQAIYALL